MKIFKILALNAVSPTVKAYSERGLQMIGDRYLYDDPICPNIETCTGENGCTGDLRTAQNGTIQVSNYPDNFYCRWEIKGPAGSTIKIKIDQGNGNFGIESQKACGYDRLHIQSYEGDRFGRLCSSSKIGSQWLVNALAKHMSYQGKQITNKMWRTGFVEIPFNHVVIGFDTDQQSNSLGFKLDYEIVGAVEEQEWSEAKEDMVLSLETSINEQIQIPHLAARMMKMHNNIFTKFDEMMGRCKNGDQSNSIHQMSSDFDLSDRDAMKKSLEDLMKSSFEACDLPITRKGYENSTWQKRIHRYFARMNKLIELEQSRAD